MTAPLVTLFLSFGLGGAPAQAVPQVEIPFACGRTFVVSQAHQVGSHRHHDAFAWDFRMPVGEPIVAAADGLVRAARGDSAVGGCHPAFAREANYVVVSHDAGFETQYLHFSRVVVAPGEQVKAGSLLGYSGKTGWACGAHLHFKVARAETPSWNNRSVPAQIRGYGDPQAGVVVSAPPCGATRPQMASLPTEEGSAGSPDAGTLAIGSASGAARLSPPAQGD